MQQFLYNTLPSNNCMMDNLIILYQLVLALSRTFKMKVTYSYLFVKCTYMRIPSIWWCTRIENNQYIKHYYYYYINISITISLTMELLQSHQSSGVLLQNQQAEVETASLNELGGYSIKWTHTYNLFHPKFTHSCHTNTFSTSFPPKGG